MVASPNRREINMSEPAQAKDDDKGKKPKEYKIQIDREHYKVAKESMTGAELRQLPNPDIPATRDLFEVVPGHPDRKLELNDTVKIVDGKRFFTAPAHINPGHAK